jgi:eukaryotic-like serine/threonine-protein kinase
MIQRDRNGAEVLSPSVDGRYQCIAKLGRGGMAEVFLARMTGPSGFAKLVVIKRLREDIRQEQPDIEGLFLNEAQVAARLNHPNIVQTFEAGRDPGGVWMAMEYLEGQALSSINKRRRTHKLEIPLSIHLHTILEVLGALHYAHTLKDFDGSALGLVHRDVSPQNIFLTYTGSVKLLDFGIAKTAFSTIETKAGVIKGKIAYMAPEQVRGGAPVTGQADIYAVGILLWEAIAGARFWGKSSDVEMFGELLRGHTASAPSERSGKPERSAFDAVCAKALAPNCEDRFESALEFQKAVEAAMRQAGVVASNREVAAFVGETFDHERRLVEASIEQHARAEVGSLPSLPSLFPESRSSIDSGERRKVERPSTSKLADYSDIVVESEPMVDVSQSVSAAFKTPQGRIIAGFAIASIVLLGICAFLFGKVSSAPTPSRLSEQAPSAQEVSLPTSAVRGESTSPAPQSITLEIVASPLNATMYLDDRPLGSNPFRGAIASSPGPHTLRVEAVGYRSRSVSLELVRDRTLDVALVPSPSPYPYAVPKYVPPQPGKRDPQPAATPSNGQTKPGLGDELQAPKERPGMENPFGK